MRFGWFIGQYRWFGCVHLPVGLCWCVWLFAVVAAPDAPRLMLLASDEEVAVILQAWVKVSISSAPCFLSPSALKQLLNEGPAPLLVALSPICHRDPSLLGLLELLDMQDPLLVQTISVISLFEQQQERLLLLYPQFRLVVRRIALGSPVRCAGPAQAFGRHFCGCCSATADCPFIGLAALLIWLEDQGLFSIPSSAVAGWVDHSRFLNCERCARMPKSKCFGLSPARSTYHPCW